MPFASRAIALLQGAVRSYIAVLVFSVACNGLLARMYGDVCGLGLAELGDLQAWGRVLGLTASPLCSSLLRLCTVAQSLAAHAWENMLSTVVLAAGAIVPRLHEKLRQDAVSP